MRTRDARNRAERALADLAHALGANAGELTVIGGLNADLLTDTSDAPHQGTVDVDIVVQLGVIHDRDDVDLGWLERGLVAAGFDTRENGPGWRWWCHIDGFPVKVELLCDVYDNPGQVIALPGCATASAQNLRGPAAAQADRVLRPTVPIPFTRLGGYVLAKAAAAWSRGLDKDYYDLVFVILHNTAGGPGAAGRAARQAIPSQPLMDYAATLRAVLASIADPSGRPARVYADQRIRDGVDVPLDVLAQDAAGAAMACQDAFG